MKRFYKPLAWLVVAGCGLAVAACSSNGATGTVSTVTVTDGIPITLESAPAGRTEFRATSLGIPDRSHVVAASNTAEISDAKRLVPTYAADIAAAAEPEGLGAGHGSVSPSE
jgi:hypothetical protein